MASDKPLIVGATVTHNAIPGDLFRAIRSLRAVSDHVLVFDDHSTDNTPDIAVAFADQVFTSTRACARALTLRRATLYAEAERLGADWFVYIDQDEELSPTIQASLRALLTNLSHGASKDSHITSVNALWCHFYKDLRHRVIAKNGCTTPTEMFAWRANNGCSYYEGLLDLYLDDGSPEAAQRAIHQPRQPAGAQDMNLTLRYPYAAILHYANSTPERLAARLEREAQTGLVNEINQPLPEHVVEVPENPEWNDVSLCRKMWEKES